MQNNEEANKQKGDDLQNSGEENRQKGGRNAEQWRREKTERRTICRTMEQRTLSSMEDIVQKQQERDMYSLAVRRTTYSSRISRQRTVDDKQDRSGENRQQGDK
jgi:hypothetical protein